MVKSQKENKQMHREMQWTVSVCRCDCETPRLDFLTFLSNHTKPTSPAFIQVKINRSEFSVETELTLALCV